MALPLCFNVHIWGGGKGKKLENHASFLLAFLPLPGTRKQCVILVTWCQREGFFCVCESYVG